MKKLILIILLVGTTIYSQGQEAIGINNDNPHASAILDITSTERGVLIPRMTTGERDAISSPANGLLIYNTTTTSFWFYNGSTWIELISNVSTDEITDADNDTKIQVEETDDEDLIRFDVAGTEYFRMDAGRLEFRNTGNSVFIGQNSGSADDLTNNNNVFVGHNSGRRNISGQRNVGVGYRSVLANTTGSDNIGLGEDALRLNTTGSYNIAIGANSLDASVTNDSNISIGYNALTRLTNGSNNIAFGLSSLTQLTSGTGNVAIGNSSLQNNTSGSNNTAIGRLAGGNATGSGNVFIGYQAGRNETGDNKLYIEPTNSATPLIWGDFSADSLVINGSQYVTNNITYVGTLTDVSDRRLKEDFDTLNQVMKLVNKLQAYSYKMKSTQKREYGLIAQEVKEVFPEMVNTIDQENGYMGVNYLQLVSILVQGLNEQQAIIEQQNDQLIHSTKKLEDLKADVNQIKSSLAID